MVTCLASRRRDDGDRSHGSKSGRSRRSASGWTGAPGGSDAREPVPPRLLGDRAGDRRPCRTHQPTQSTGRARAGDDARTSGRRRGARARVRYAYCATPGDAAPSSASRSGEVLQDQGLGLAHREAEQRADGDQDPLVLLERRPDQRLELQFVQLPASSGRAGCGCPWCRGRSPRRRSSSRAGAP